MARFCGNVGFVCQVLSDDQPDVYVEQEIVRKYKGDLISDTVKWDQSDRVNDSLNINNQVSILADSFAYENAYVMKYVEYLGVKWRIQSIDIKRPRIVLRLGGVYNGHES